MTKFPVIAESPGQSPRPGLATMSFPASFLWGVSTAGHQVEGGNDNSQWSAWEAAGKTKCRAVSGLACDWWNNAERDFDLAQEMGLNALRLSVEWSRIEPSPREWNGDALRRYRKMLQELQRRGIQPFVSLHHFTHPKWFERDGAFLTDRAADRFGGFAARLVSELGDLCHHWVTFNEPNVFAALGYVLGEFPPGQVGNLTTALRLMDRMALCHARAYEKIHESSRKRKSGGHTIMSFSNLSVVTSCWIAGSRDC